MMEIKLETYHVQEALRDYIAKNTGIDPKRLNEWEIGLSTPQLNKNGKASKSKPPIKIRRFFQYGWCDEIRELGEKWNFTAYIDDNIEMGIDD